MAVERRLTEIVGAGRRQAAHGALAQRPGRHRHGDVHPRARAAGDRGAAGPADRGRAASPRRTWTGRCPATRTCSARSRSTSRTTCWPTSGCSGATRARFEVVLGSTTELPLGAGALAGVNFADRPAAGGLASSASRAWSPNSIDAVSNRDFVLDFLAAAATCATHLSRLGAEIVLWSSEEFGFCEVRDDWASSLLDHAAEEEPGRGRAAARQGAADRGSPGRAARRDARPPADLQQGHAGGQGAPLRRRRHARAVPGGGARDARRRSTFKRERLAGRRDRRDARRGRRRRHARQAAACRSGSRTGSSPGWCATAVESGPHAVAAHARGARRSTPTCSTTSSTRCYPRGRGWSPRRARAGRRWTRVREQLAHARAALDVDVLDATSFYDRPVLEVAPELLGCVVAHGDCAGRDRRDRGLPLLRAGLPRLRRRDAAHARPATGRRGRPTSTAPTASTRC